MKLLWVIVICACWLSLLVQPQQCMGFTKLDNGDLETSQVEPGYPINVPNNHHFTSSLLSVVSPISRLTLQQKQQQEMRGNDKNQGADGSNLDLEPKLHITGFNGLCVSVKDGDYHNGNAIVLSECKDGQENQLWTFRSDQTIRSGGKCLTTYGYSPGVYVMIFDCNTAVSDATKWEFQSNLRSIINPRSMLSLTAENDGTGNYNLVVNYHTFVPRQVWHPTNMTKPLVTKIVGYQSLCLTRDVKMAVCGQNVKDERWALYPDGTIRPEQDQGQCLRFEYGQHRLSVGRCGGWTNEPWIINQSDGTILHVATGMVLDIKVTQVRPILYAPFLNCYDGRVSQKWFFIPPDVSA